MLSTLMAFLMLMSLTACAEKQETGESTDLSMEKEWEDAVKIVLSDTEITVNETKAGKESVSGVTVGGEIIYYHDMESYASGNPYGEGTDGERHSEEEAADHTLVTITKPGAYLISGTLSAGQIAVDLGEEAVEDPEAVVTLILDNVDLTCTVAPAIIFYNVYECGNTVEDSLGAVDTKSAGANVVLADGSENIIKGSHVAKIYEDFAEVKKLAKFDGAFYSKQSMNIEGSDGDKAGKLTVVADNEGIGSELHLTINGGNIEIQSQDDGINTNEDGFSVTTINGGDVTVFGGLGAEGDGIDSNGYLTINGGRLVAYGRSDTGDGGIDADCSITINGGTVYAFGGRNDEVSNDSCRNTIQLTMGEEKAAQTILSLREKNGNVVLELTAERPFRSVTLSSPELAQNVSYEMYVNEKKQQYSLQMEKTEGPGFGLENPGRSGEGWLSTPPEGFEDWLREESNVPQEIRDWLWDVYDEAVGRERIPPSQPVRQETDGMGGPEPPKQENEGGQIPMEGEMPRNEEMGNSTEFLLIQTVSLFYGVTDA